MASSNTTRIRRPWFAPGLRERERVRRCGGELQPYRPLDKFESLFTQFANEAISASGLLQFIKKFGPLTKFGLDESLGEPIAEALEHAKAMREWLSYLAGKNSRLVERMGLEQGGIRLSDATVRLTLDMETNRPRLEFSPSSLLGALWAQFGASVSGNATFHLCLHCGKHFLSGTGTDRRADAKFCSREHKVAFHSLNRSRKK